MALIPLLQSTTFGDIDYSMGRHIDNWGQSLAWLPTTWDANPYTGAGVPTNGTYQRGLNDTNGGYGSTTIQSNTGVIGLYLNGFSTPSWPDTKQWSLSASDKWRHGIKVRPWANGQSLHVGVSQKLRGCYMTNVACGYTYIHLFLYDPLVKKTLDVLYHTWDSRNVTQPPNAGYSTETGGASIAWVSVGVGYGGSTYMTNLGAAYQTGQASRDTNYWFIVTAAQLQNLLAKARSDLAGFDKFGMDATVLETTTAIIQAEIAPSVEEHYQYIQGQFGISVSGVNIISQ